MRDFARLIRSWLNGTYRVFPWRTLFVLVLVGLYAINPFDIIPDFIPIIGVIDDAAMLGFLYRSLRKDVKQFLAWERSRTSVEPQKEVVDAEFEVVKEEKRSVQG
jgi:uncharacterized membrane protein YkvA (DUF1232 family)